MSFRRTALAMAGFMLLLASIVVVTRPGDEVAIEAPEDSLPASLAMTDGSSDGPEGAANSSASVDGDSNNSNDASAQGANQGGSLNKPSSVDSADVEDASNDTSSPTTPATSGPGDTAGTADYQRPGSTTSTTTRTPVTADQRNGGTTATTAGSTPGTTTRPPVTRPPVTQAPTTQAPVTQAPTTQAPVTQAPTTQAPTLPPVIGAAFAGINIADWTNSDAIVSSDGQDGSFRTACTTSHFNFDDAIVFPGQQNATHLHMYFGNTLANYASTGDSLMASGDGTCQGGPLNRSAYWVPAMMDQNGQARPAQYMLAYYKRAGDEAVVPFPNGLKIVVGDAMSHDPQPGREQPVDAGIDYRWYCGSPITTGAYNSGRLIPDCAQGDFVTLSLIFPRCGDGRLDSADHKSHMAYPAYYGGPCPSSHPIRHPQLTYNIHWNNNDARTGDWYLSSDDHRAHGDGLLPGGTTTHADWVGAWSPEILDIMTPGCLNASHDCKGGTISSTMRLNSPNIQGYSPSNIYNPGAAPTSFNPSQFR